MGDYKTPVGAVINLETGEITREIYDGDTFSIRHSSQTNFMDKYIPVPDRDRPFVKLYTDIIDYLDEHLSLAEFRFIIKLSKIVSYNDCIIRKSPSPLSDIASLHDIAAITKDSYDNTKKIMKSLLNKGIVGKHETGYIVDGYIGKRKTVYTVNPFIFFKGISVNKLVYAFYKDTGWNNIGKG